jgi:hypothetical protein
MPLVYEALAQLDGELVIARVHGSSVLKTDPTDPAPAV